MEREGFSRASCCRLRSLLGLLRGLGPDPLAQPVDRLRMAGDERLPLGFRESDANDTVALVAHGVSIRIGDVQRR